MLDKELQGIKDIKTNVHKDSLSYNNHLETFVMQGQQDRYL